MKGIHRWLVDSPHKGPVTQKMLPLVDIIMVTTIGAWPYYRHKDHLWSPLSDPTHSTQTSRWKPFSWKTYWWFSAMELPHSCTKAFKQQFHIHMKFRMFVVFSSIVVLVGCIHTIEGFIKGINQGMWSNPKWCGYICHMFLLRMKISTQQNKAKENVHILSVCVSFEHFIGKANHTRNILYMTADRPTR